MPPRGEIPRPNSPPPSEKKSLEKGFSASELQSDRDLFFRDGQALRSLDRLQRQIERQNEKRTMLDSANESLLRIKDGLANSSSALPEAPKKDRETTFDRIDSADRRERDLQNQLEKLLQLENDTKDVLHKISSPSSSSQDINISQSETANTDDTITNQLLQERFDNYYDKLTENNLTEKNLINDALPLLETLNASISDTARKLQTATEYYKQLEARFELYTPTLQKLIIVQKNLEANQITRDAAKATINRVDELERWNIKNPEAGKTELQGHLEELLQLKKDAVDARQKVSSLDLPLEVLDTSGAEINTIVDHYIKDSFVGDYEILYDALGREMSYRRDTPLLLRNAEAQIKTLNASIVETASKWQGGTENYNNLNERLVQLSSPDQLRQQIVAEIEKLHENHLILDSAHKTLSEIENTANELASWSEAPKSDTETTFDQILSAGWHKIELEDHQEKFLQSKSDIDDILENKIPSISSSREDINISQSETTNTGDTTAQELILTYFSNYYARGLDNDNARILLTKHAESLIRMIDSFMTNTAKELKTVTEKYDKLNEQFMLYIPIQQKLTTVQMKLEANQATIDTAQATFNRVDELVHWNIKDYAEDKTKLQSHLEKLLQLRTDIVAAKHEVFSPDFLQMEDIDRLKLGIGKIGDISINGDLDKLKSEIGEIGDSKIKRDFMRDIDKQYLTWYYNNSPYKMMRLLSSVEVKINALDELINATNEALQHNANTPGQIVKKLSL